jgi:thiosulfate/3-mercaptopyruvate sulfurtransferase
MRNFERHDVTHTALLSVAQLQQMLSSPDADLLLVDCSFDLGDPAAGLRAYRAGHIPGAYYVSLDETMSATKTGSNGRHPMPERAVFAKAMAALGMNAATQVVVYDNAGNMYAARLWWMLRWAGHAAAAVLDGGMAAWKAADGAIETDMPADRAPGDFALRTSLVTTVTFAEVLANVDSGARLLIDARAPDRFRGENETLDPIGGHIPGAVNRLFRNNLASDGCFKPAAELHAEFSAVIGGRAPSEVINQCGSGVTACHNLLAMEVAGLRGAALYPGSWSEWVAQPGAPIASS